MSTQKLADFVVGLGFDAIPSEVREATGRYVLDVVGKAFAGLATEHGNIAIRFAREFDLAREATLIGGNGRSSAMHAAFANTVLGAASPAGDTNAGGTTNPGIPVTMACLAVGERVRATGKELITSVNAGQEVALRVAEAVSPWLYEDGFSVFSTCSTFGTTAAAGKLLSLNSEQMARALGLAGSQASGLRRYEVDGDRAVGAFHAAKAAQSGIISALLAKAGFPASPTILEGEYGFCRTFSRSFDPDRLTEGLGERFKIMENQPGGPGSPFSDKQLERKFSDNVEPVLGRAEAQELLHTMMRMDQLQSVCELTCLLGKRE